MDEIYTSNAKTIIGLLLLELTDKKASFVSINRSTPSFIIAHLETISR